MHEKIDILHELCGELMDELEEVNEKIRKADGMNAGDLEAVDKLSHALKSIKTTIAMMEAGGDGYSSGRYVPARGAYYYADERMSDGRGSSYERGRMNAPRDSMGRYSGAVDALDNLLDEMRGMMGSLPEEKRREVQKFVDRMER